MNGPDHNLPISGQENPVTLRELAIELRDETLQWDRGFPGTVRWLLQDPAMVVRSFVWQRSTRFTRPLRFLLISVAVTLLLDWLVHRQLALPSPLAPTGKFNNFLLEHSTVLLLMMLPVMAVLLRFTFFGLQLRYVDALITLAYTQALVNLFGAVLIPLVALAPGDQWTLGISSLLLAGYAVWAWASVGIGAAWRRWLAAVLALILCQLLNAAFLNALALVV